MTEDRRERDEDRLFERVGNARTGWNDAYAFLLQSGWGTVVGLAFTVFLLTNALFALLFWTVPGSVAHTDGSFSDAFFFSVQTFGAIGYGHMYSQGLWGHSVVVLEAFVSLLCIALLTGIVFAKFSRPHARVLFSKSVCVEARNGVPTLTFRLANERGNDVAEASIRASVLKTVVSAEGKEMRRFFDLDLERSSSPFFRLSWQVFHPIDDKSPLYGLSAEDLVADDVRLVVSLTGIDATFSQTIHARHGYWAEEILFGRRFVDVMQRLDHGRIRMDYTKFHLTAPDGADRVADDERAG